MGGIGKRRPEALLPCSLPHQPHVLDEDVEGALRGDELTLKHTFTPVLEHERVGRPVPDRLEHRPGIEAQRFRVSERLSRRRDMHSAEQLVDQLYGLPGPHRPAAVRHRRPHRREHRPDLIEQISRTSRHDEQVSALGPRHPAADGRVEQLNSTPGQSPFDPADRLWPDGAHDYHGGPRRQGLGCAISSEQGVFGLLRVHDHQDERFGSLGRLSRRACVPGPQLDQWISILGAYIEGRKVETGGDDPLRHRGAHRPESYESGALHLSLPKDPSMIVAGCLRGDAPVLQGTFEYPAAVELIHGGAIDLLPGRLALGEVRDAFLSLAAFYLLVGDQHVTASGAQVDTDGIPRPQPGQAASRGALRRGVQDRRAVRGARLPAVAYGWQGVDPTLEERVWGLHVDDLGRARPPDWSCAPDHQNRGLVDVEVRVVDTLVVVVRAVEDDRASLEHVFVGRISQVALAELVRDHTGLDDSEVEEIAGEDPKTRLLLKRFVVGCDHLTVLALSPGYAFGQRPASDGPRPAVDLASLQKLAQHGRHAARAVKPLAQVLTRRLHIDEQGHIVAVLPIRGFDLDPRVARHGHDVRLGVGRAAYSRGRDDRVQKRLAREDPCRAQILVGHLSAALPCVVGHLPTLAVGRRDCCASRQRETEHLGQGIHCRGRTHSVAVARRRRGSQGRLEELLFVDLASGQTAAALPDGRARTYQFALEVTVEHRTAGEHDGGDIHGRGGHDRRRRGLVAAGRKHHGVDKVTVEYLHEPKIREVAVQRGGRPAAVLVDGVHGELHRDAPTVAYPIAHATGELQMMPVAGREVASALGDADYGPVGAQLVRCDPVVHKAL